MKTSALEPLCYLHREQMDAIHHAALQILERTGMWIDHVQALEYLRAAGFHVDMDRRAVKFHPEQVEAAAGRMRCNFQAPNRWPKRMSVPVSPWIRTVEFVGATRSTFSKTTSRAGL
jgi:trimethylamine:corrinoid methyltransferase-like protein